MDIITTLKKLQHIESDPRRRAQSRETILCAIPQQRPAGTVWQWILSNVEAGATLALAGLCLFLVLAGFSILRSFSPLGIARLDLASIRAEAQAIDIQIELAGLRYQESTVPIVREERAQAPAPRKAETPEKERAQEVPAPVSAPETASTTPSLTIEEALLELSK